MLNIIKKPCTNFFQGRSGQKPEAIVLHIMDGTLVGTDSWFATPSSMVSATYGIGKTGEIHQYVDEANGAWANGIINQPNWKLLKAANINPNLYTISIEHEGGPGDVWPQTQIQASAALIKDICGRYGIPIDRDHIIGHYQIDSVKKPNCPAYDKSIIDKVIAAAQATNDPMVSIQCPASKVEKIKKIIDII